MGFGIGAEFVEPFHINQSIDLLTLSCLVDTP
jgi:hypothetical protein